MDSVCHFIQILVFVTDSIGGQVAEPLEVLKNEVGCSTFWLECG
jgi:hypothetical protein